MSAQDTTERVLRSLHVMISKSEIYEFDEDKIIVDREKIVGLLKELNKSIYAMMEEYEMTKESRDQAERDFRKHADEIINDANRKAEDIYAASVMYTDEALGNIQGIMSEAEESVKKIYQEMEKRLQKERYLVRENQTELKSQLQDLSDTEKYLMLITDRNREIQKEKEKEQRLQRKKEEKAIYADRKTDIRVDEEALRRLGLQPEDAADAGESPAKSGADYTDRQTEVRVDTERLRKLGLQKESSGDPEKEASASQQSGGSGQRTSGINKARQASDGGRLRSETGVSEQKADRQSAGQTARRKASVRRVSGDSTGDKPITPIDLAGPAEAETEVSISEEDELIRLDLDADYFKWKDEQDAAMNAEAAKEKNARRRKK